MNPCAEISLRPYQFCNLVTINASDLEDQEDYNDSEEEYESSGLNGLGGSAISILEPQGTQKNQFTIIN